jgi:serine/threonine protein kinase
MGSPNYMAPELFTQSYGSEQTDVFSLGVTLYEMLTGNFPYGYIDLHSKYEGHKYISAKETIHDCPDWFDAFLEPIRKGYIDT